MKFNINELKKRERINFPKSVNYFCAYMKDAEKKLERKISKIEQKIKV